MLKPVGLYSGVMPALAVCSARCRACRKSKWQCAGSLVYRGPYTNSRNYKYIDRAFHEGVYAAPHAYCLPGTQAAGVGMSCCATCASGSHARPGSFGNPDQVARLHVVSNTYTGMLRGTSGWARMRCTSAMTAPWGSPVVSQSMQAASPEPGPVLASCSSLAVSRWLYLQVVSSVLYQKPKGGFCAPMTLPAVENMIDPLPTPG